MEKKYIYAKAANGMTVRIPAEKYPAWKKAQEQQAPVDEKQVAELKKLLGLDK